MSQEEEPPGTDLVVPVTGEIINLQDPGEVCRALETLREIKTQIRQVENALTVAILQHSKDLGKKTIPLPDGHKAVVKGSTQTTYDAIGIMEGLAAAGMPDHRIQEIVVETVEYKVRAVEAKRAADANPAYKTVIEQHSVTEEKRPSISIE